LTAFNADFDVFVAQVILQRGVTVNQGL
jgi:hypothetical protein